MCERSCDIWFQGQTFFLLPFRRGVVVVGVVGDAYLVLVGGFLYADLDLWRLYFCCLFVLNLTRAPISFGWLVERLLLLFEVRKDDTR